MIEWPEKIEMIIKELNITKKKLASEMKVNASYISALSIGNNKNPSTFFLKKLCDLGVSADWLINDRGSVLANSDVKQYLTSDGEVVKIHAELAKRGYDDISVTVVNDNNMQPALSRGDIAVYSAGLIDGDGIYAITDGDRCIIRRLQFMHQENELLIISDNAQYPPRRLPLSSINNNFKINGRVFCRILFD